MSPCADLSAPMDPVQDVFSAPPPPLPMRRNTEGGSSQEEDDDDSLYDHSELSVYANENTDPESHVLGDRQWIYEEDPYYDDIFQGEEFIEDHFNSENESDISVGDFSEDEVSSKPVTTTRVINLFDQQS